MASMALTLTLLTSFATAQTWTTTGNLNVARGGPGTAILGDGRVLVQGGGDSSGAINSAEVYDPSTATWTLTSPILEGHAGPETTVRLADGRVLVCGGVIQPNPTFTNLCEIYDPVTGIWSRTGSMNQARAHHQMVLLPNSKVLAMGGDPGSYSFFNSAELYDPSIGTWQFAASMAVARNSFSATLLPNGKVLVAAGELPGGSSATTAAELYDPSSGTWSPTGSLNMARSGHIAVLLGNGGVLVVGGSTGNGCATLTDTAELYDPSTGTWSATGSLSAPLIGHGASLLSNGQVLVAGGLTGSCATTRRLLIRHRLTILSAASGMLDPQ